jgi:hypothetical protein
MVSADMVSADMVSADMVSADMVSADMVSADMVSSCPVRSHGRDRWAGLGGPGQGSGLGFVQVRSRRVVQVVLAISKLQGVSRAIALGTEPKTRLSMPLLPTTIRSAPTDSATSITALAGAWLTA